MICPSCKASDVYSIRYFGNGLVQCKFCPDKYTPVSQVGLFIRAINPGSVGKRTIAHDRDISRRRLAEDGRTVIRT